MLRRGEKNSFRSQNRNWISPGAVFLGKGVVLQNFKRNSLAVISSSMKGKKTSQQFGNMFYFTNKIESVTFFQNLLENLKERMVLSLWLCKTLLVVNKLQIKKSCNASKWANY